MERMERIRGSLVDAEDQIVLREFDGHLASVDNRGRMTHYGYFEMPTEQLTVLNPQTCYHLHLHDGRKATVYTQVVPSNVQGNSVAQFHVSGPLKKK